MNAVCDEGPSVSAVEPHLIAGYLRHLGEAETRIIIGQVAGNAEALIERLARLAEGAPEDCSARQLAHDIAGTLGSLGFAVHAAFARALEAAPEFEDARALGRWLGPLAAMRGRIALSALAVLDALLARPEGRP